MLAMARRAVLLVLEFDLTTTSILQVGDTHWDHLIFSQQQVWDGQAAMVLALMKARVVRTLGDNSHLWDGLTRPRYDPHLIQPGYDSGEAVVNVHMSNTGH